MSELQRSFLRRVPAPSLHRALGEATVVSKATHRCVDSASEHHFGASRGGEWEAR